MTDDLKQKKTASKKKEQEMAYFYYVQKGLTAKECALKVGVTENTLGKWVEIGGWKEARAALSLSNNNQIHNIKTIIARMANDRLEMMDKVIQSEQHHNMEDADKLRKQIASIDDGVAKWNKTLETLDKKNQVSLAAYLHVHDDIFKQLRERYPKFYFENLVDFQTEHIMDVSKRYA